MVFPAHSPEPEVDSERGFLLQSDIFWRVCRCGCKQPHTWSRPRLLAGGR